MPHLTFALRCSSPLVNITFYQPSYLKDFNAVLKKMFVLVPLALDEVVELDPLCSVPPPPLQHTEKLFVYSRDALV